jgi:DNA repair protein RecO
MLHHVYTTRGFVVGGMPIGESNKYLYIFTKELGLVGATAQSVRDLKSKLRYALQDLSLSTVSLVRGKNVWRVVNAVPEKNFQTIFRGEEQKILLSAHVLSLIKKLVVGEEKNPELFDILNSAFEFLEKENLTSLELRNAECILMLRIIHNLGYLGNSKNLNAFISDQTWNRGIIALMDPYYRESIKTINESLQESQL